MATKLQRKILWQFINENSRGILLTGHKSTDWGARTSDNGGGAVIRCSEVVLQGLRANKFIEKETQEFTPKIADHFYRITEKGIKAAGKREPEMKASYLGSHGIRWS